MALFKSLLVHDLGGCFENQVVTLHFGPNQVNSYSSLHLLNRNTACKISFRSAQDTNRELLYFIDFFDISTASKVNVRLEELNRESLLQHFWNVYVPVYGIPFTILTDSNQFWNRNLTKDIYDFGIQNRFVSL